MPIRKLTTITTHSFRDLVICAPTRSPIGSMAVSAPSVKSPIPTISRTAPTRKASNTSDGTGAMVKQRIRTISVIGSTEVSASRTFSPNTVFVWPIRFRQLPWIFSSKGPASLLCSVRFVIFYHKIRNLPSRSAEFSQLLNRRNGAGVLHQRTKLPGRDTKNRMRRRGWQK